MSLWKYRVCGVALIAAALVVGGGCGPTATTTTKNAKTGHAHDHPDEGPHHGALAEWGDEEYHVEFTVRHDKKRATVYVLDGKAKKSVPIPADSLTLTIKNVQPPATIILKPDPLVGEPEGTSSRFIGEHDALAKEMEFEGEISGKVGDKPYAGEFKEKAHADHKHK